MFDDDDILNSEIPKPTKKPSLEDAMAVIYDAIKQDRLFADRFLEKIDRKTILSFMNKPRLDPYPADVETVELSIWDNDFGKKSSKMDARYCLEVRANRKGNTKLVNPDFSASADLLTPKQIRKRAKRWALSPADTATFDEVVSSAERSNLLVGRFLRVVRFQGSHTFENHYALVSPIEEGAPSIILSMPSCSAHYDADKTTNASKTTNSAGKEFAVVPKGKGFKSKVIYQCRHSTAASLSDWWSK